MKSRERDEEAQKAFDEIRDVVGELEASYWVPLLSDPFDALNKMLEGLAGDATPLEQPFRAFVSNLRAAKDLLDFPYLLMAPFLIGDSDANRRLQELKAAGANPADEEFLGENLEFTHLLVSTVLRKSNDHLKKQRPELLNRLMHQACLLTWGAFEVYCKDVFIAALNKRPDLYGVIAKNQKLKERFSIAQGAWPNILEKNAYDLTGKLGTIIGADRDFSSPQLLKDLFPVLFAELGAPDEFLRVFESPELWLVGQRRHLIAHRCGIVDAEYVRKCNDSSQEIGRLLFLRGRDLAESLSVVARAASFLYGAARRCWICPPVSDGLQPVA